ncbi:MULTISPECIES: hypothetical protein [Pseudomonas]|uniref:Uncharacterized protein n=1 Tax=Pseudomonas quercus TaxID=2722792 RepID=A0ABX0YC50_9PSED|nr:MULTISPECIES: hypothetical protein [Pseudomonas]MBF7141425.1 hypothetical protein [Pseudomonas sp. LY10J]NJO99963.1 hypothetical protein [Pseudomonas quercus]
MEQPLSTPLDKVYILRIDGARFGPYHTRLEQGKALIWEVTLNAGAGDTLEHHPVNGPVASYPITNTHFQPRMKGIEAHYTVRLRTE